MEEMDFENRIVAPEFIADDSETELSLRPKTLDDYIGQDKNGRTIVAFCYYSKPMVTYEDYKQNLLVMRQAKLQAEQIYLFAGGHFEEKLRLESKVKGNVILLEMDDL